MRKILVTLSLFSALFTQLAHASCGEKYEAEIQRLEPLAAEQESIDHHRNQVGMALIGAGFTTGLFIIPGLPVEGSMMGLSAGALVAEGAVSVTFHDLDGHPVGALSLARESLGVLREAYLGDGETMRSIAREALLAAGPEVDKNKITGPEMARIAVGLDRQDEFCRDGSIDSAYQIRAKILKNVR